MPIEANSLNAIKNTLKDLDKNEVVSHLMRLAKYKKENKELLSYILFLEGDKEQFVMDVKHEMDQMYKSLNISTNYLSAKGLRKILKMVNKYIKFSGDKKAEVEWLIYFCQKMRASSVRIASSTVLANLYDRQLQRIYRALDNLHEEERMDFRSEIRELEGH